MKWKRTHTCGQLSSTNLGQGVTLMGWVSTRRDHGGIIFVDLRDRWGVTQINIRPESSAYEEAKKLRAKYRNLLSQVKKQIKYLRGALRGKESI